MQDSDTNMELHPFNSISVISRQWEDDYEGLYAVNRHLGSTRNFPPEGVFEDFLLTYCILVDSSTVICWMSSFVIFGVLGLFCCFYSIFDEKSC